MAKDDHFNQLPPDHNAILVLANAIRESSDTELARNVVRLLKLHEKRYLDGLRTVRADDLAKQQGVLAQCSALIELFSGAAVVDGSA